MNEDRCYFGCEGPIYHTLLELPPPYSGTPNLCESHSKSWRLYQAALRSNGGDLSWPDAFWSWADKERKTMEEARKTEDRKPGTEILAEEAVPGAWYAVPSGEMERCHSKRPRGRGTQVGFVAIWDTGSDGDEIRYLQGRTSILVADEVEASKTMVAYRETGAQSDLAWDLCPRNGLVCRECGLPQRETPRGATCDTRHGGVPGISAVEAANRVGSEGYTEEARAIRDSVPPSAANPVDAGETDFMALGVSQESAHGDQGSPTLREKYPKAFVRSGDLQAGSPAMTPEEIAEEYPDVLAHTVEKLTPEQLQKAAEALASLKARTNLSIVVGTDEGPKEVPLPAKGAGPTTIFHKSLHTDHRTPRELFEAEVKRWGRFYLDCAATEENKLCEYALTPEIDALSVDWAGTEEIYEAHGRNRWLNHPYSAGEEACPEDRSLCTKRKCAERGYHIDKRIASSGEWICYARDQVLKDGVPTDVLTKAAIDTNWWRDAIRVQPLEAGVYITGAVDPLGGPAAEYLNATPYKAGMWFRLTWEHLVVEVTEIQGRVAFEREGNKGGAGFASALVMFYRPGHKFHG